jgi:hypothetical protein
MRFQYTYAVSKLLRDLGESGAPLRAAIRALQSNPTPADAISVPERPGRYEQHVRIGTRGFWLVWRLEQDRGEQVITITAIDEN